MQHETRLWHRTLEGIDEQQTAVGHVEHTLHLTTKIRVTRGVENIDLHSFPSDGHVFGKDGYPSLALQIIGVQYFAAVVLAVTEQFTSEHHLVNQRSFAMVDMRNNCDVTNVLHYFTLIELIICLQNYKKNW